MRRQDIKIIVYAYLQKGVNYAEKYDILREKQTEHQRQGYMR